jgi:hypothetical protein
MKISLKKLASTLEGVKTHHHYERGTEDISIGNSNSISGSGLGGRTSSKIFFELDGVT